MSRPKNRHELQVIGLRLLPFNFNHVTISSPAAYGLRLPL